ncbi:MAG: hypothetical protein J6T73_06695 [Clostridia bacterium]|nr:hypothetical protein [Clostridia bacterium]
MFKTTELSLAIPRKEPASGRFEVIEKSIITSSSPKTSLISVPGFGSPLRIKMPFSSAPS